MDINDLYSILFVVSCMLAVRAMHDYWVDTVRAISPKYTTVPQQGFIQYMLPVWVAYPLAYIYIR